MPAAARWKPDAEAITRHGTTPARTHVVAVHVGEEGLERPDPLGDAGLDAHPLVRCDHARNDVERERTLLAGHVEGHALVEVAAGQGVGARLEVRTADRRPRASHPRPAPCGSPRRDRPWSDGNRGMSHGRYISRPFR